MRERALETLASAGQSRHNGANGNGSNNSNLLIRTALQLAKDKDFPEARGQRFEGPSQALAVVTGDGQGLGSTGRFFSNQV